MPESTPHSQGEGLGHADAGELSQPQTRRLAFLHASQASRRRPGYRSWPGRSLYNTLGCCQVCSSGHSEADPCLWSGALLLNAFMSFMDVCAE